MADADVLSRRPGLTEVDRLLGVRASGMQTIGTSIQRADREARAMCLRVYRRHGTCGRLPLPAAGVHGVFGLPRVHATSRTPYSVASSKARGSHSSAAAVSP